MLHQFTTAYPPDHIVYNEKDDMNLYSNLPTPPMSGSEGSLSPPQGFGNFPASPFPLSSYITFGNKSLSDKDKPRLEIVEQPVEKFRFRYRSEMQGTHGCLNGQNSDKTRRQTFPSVRLRNFTSDAIIRCSLYEYKYSNQSQAQPHAHRLVQKNGMQEAVDPHDKEINHRDEYIAIFHNLGIIHTARKFLVEELLKKKRKLKEEEIWLKEGAARSLKLFEEAQIKSEANESAKSMNLNTVCLRFDAFVKVNNGCLQSICEPVFSHAINNLKSALTGDLKITRMSHCTSPVMGGKEVFLLVEKVTKKNIKVRFFEVDTEEKEIWTADANFNDGDVHHQYAIVIQTPKYRLEKIENDVTVFIELYRPTDGVRSEPLPFTYYPDRMIKRKRPKYDTSSSMSMSSSELPAVINSLTEIEPPMIQQLDVINWDTAIAGVDSDEFLKFISEPQIKDIFENSMLLQTDALNNPSITKEDFQIIDRTFKEITCVLNTNPPLERIKVVTENNLKKHINSKGNNALHLMYDNSLKNQKAISYLLKFFIFLICKYKLYKLLDITNYYSETVMHLAIKYDRLEFMDLFINVSDLTKKDCKGNSPLHIAVLNSNKKGCELLLASTNVQKFINLENNVGDTALHICANNNNFEILKMLCGAKCNVNVIDKKIGDNVLHKFILKKNVEAVKFLIENTDIDIKHKNYKDLDCWFLPKITDLTEIADIIENHLKKNGEYPKYDVKMEQECDSEEDDEESMEYQENISSEELRELYKGTARLTKNCLEMIGNILDKEERWKRLPEKLDLQHMLRTDLFNGCKYPTKAFLEFALGIGISTYQIREALVDLKEDECVSIMDEMVKSTKSK